MSSDLSKMESKTVTWSACRLQRGGIQSDVGIRGSDDTYVTVVLRTMCSHTISEQIEKILENSIGNMVENSEELGLAMFCTVQSPSRQHSLPKLCTNLVRLFSSFFHFFEFFLRRGNEFSITFLVVLGQKKAKIRCQDPSR